MSDWSTVSLAEVCTINPRLGRSDRPDDDEPVSFVPMAALDEARGVIVAGEARQYRSVAKGYTAFQDGDVLFAKITPCMENGKAAVARKLIGGLGFGSTEFHVLRPGPRLDREYLFHWIRRPDFRRQAKAHFTGTAGQQRVPTSFLEGVRLPLPPLDEQRRIADILDRAARIRRLRWQGEETARQIVPALFAKTFGEPGSNPRGWPVEPFGNLLSGCDYGTSTKSVDDPNGIPTIRMGNVTVDGRLDLTSLKYFPADSENWSRYALEKGDLLFNRTNSKELVGKMGLWDGGMEAVAASYFIRVRVDTLKILPEYAWAYFNTPFMKKRLFETARGAIGQANINAKELRAFPLAIPPMCLQDEFVEQAASLMRIGERQAQAVRREEQIEAALRARLFG
jgi:type I restriction enzyme S subunit